MKRITVGRIPVGSREWVERLVAGHLGTFDHLVEMHDHTPRQAAEVVIRTLVRRLGEPKADPFGVHTPRKAIEHDAILETEPVTIQFEKFVLTTSDVARCPRLSLRPEHYRPDGSCRCTPDDPGVTVQTDSTKEQP